MRSSPVSLYLRVRSAEGGWLYARSVTASNGRIRPLHALIDGKPVFYAGILRGNNQEATCVISAVEVTHVGTGQTALTRLSIESVSKPLSEGPYELQYNGTNNDAT